MLIPAVLFMRGNDMFIDEGTRCTAVTDGTTTFDLDALTKAQPAPKSPSPEVAELYIYRKEDKISLDWPVAIGEKFVGNLNYGPGRFIHMRLRPGTCWLNSGEPNHDTGRSDSIRKDPNTSSNFNSKVGKLTTSV